MLDLDSGRADGMDHSVNLSFSSRCDIRRNKNELEPLQLEFEQVSPLDRGLLSSALDKMVPSENE